MIIDPRHVDDVWMLDRGPDLPVEPLPDSPHDQIEEYKRLLFEYETFGPRPKRFRISGYEVRSMLARGGQRYMVEEAN
jgi:hypothetical protein